MRKLAVIAFTLLFQHTAARRRLVRSEERDTSRQTGFNTQPPEGGWVEYSTELINTPEFQHTAARRRLGRHFDRSCDGYRVSTHSRPKAAGVISRPTPFHTSSFNTQPPEGGWDGQRQL